MVQELQIHKHNIDTHILQVMIASGVSQ